MTRCFKNREKPFTEVFGLHARRKVSERSYVSQQFSTDFRYVT